MEDLASLQTDIGLKWYLQQQKKKRNEFQALPQNLVQPQISGGTNPAEEAETSDGEWSSATELSFTYQWQANGVDIPGANGKRLLLLVGMLGQSITCIVRATNRFGFKLAVTAAIVVVL